MAKAKQESVPVSVVPQMATTVATFASVPNPTDAPVAVPSMAVGELVKKIESMSGKEKQAFCRTLTADQKKQYLGYLRDRDMETVTAVFRCFEPMGGMVKMTACPYEGCEATYEFWDGQTYTIPIYLAKRFNNEFQGVGTWYPTHAHIMDAAGRPIIGVGKRNYRFGMNSPALM